jgi:hypothetical protein
MSLRNQPPSERAFATFVILALAAILTGGLASTLRQAPGRQGSAPAPRPRLMAVLEGVMAPNVSSAETEAFRVWMQGGATREGFGRVAVIVTNNCARCHGQGGQFPRIAGFEDLRPLALDEGSDGLYSLIGPRALHLVLIPLVFLVAGFGYLLRTTWAHRRILAGGCLAAVLLDAGQWWMHQGRPETLWVSWTASTALAVTMAILVATVLRDLWGAKQD